MDYTKSQLEEIVKVWNNGDIDFDEADALNDKFQKEIFINIDDLCELSGQRTEVYITETYGVHPNDMPDHQAQKLYEDICHTFQLIKKEDLIVDNDIRDYLL